MSSELAAASDLAKMNDSGASARDSDTASSFPEVLRAILSPSAKVGLRLTPHGGRLTGPRAHVTPELRAGMKVHRGRLTTLAKVMQSAGQERGRSLTYPFQTWPGDLEAGFLTCWFAEFGGRLKSEHPFELSPVSTITDPPRFLDSVHVRLLRLQEAESLPGASKTTLRRDLANLYRRFGYRAEALPDPTGTCPPVVEEPAEKEDQPRAQSTLGASRAA